MLHHAAMFTLREGPERLANARKLAAWLLRLRAEIAELDTLSVELNEVPSAAEADMLMLATYRSAADLARVRANPLHQAMMRWYLAVAIDSDRREVNFTKARD